MDTTDSPRFCFCAIVKDEAPNIQRCLDSVSNIASMYFISDTGSTDNTVEIIERHGKNQQQPCQVLHAKWENYGFNRSLVLWHLRKTAPFSECQYIIWLDADEVFLKDASDFTSYPTKADADDFYKTLESHPNNNVFYLKTHYGSAKYWRWQVVRNDREYQYRMPYQEYLDVSGSSSAYLTDFVNLARHEGNSSRDPDCTRRRIAMMETWLEHDDEMVLDQEINGKSETFRWPGPIERERPRICFYLAEAWRLIDKTRAIDLFRERLDMTGYDEERYESMMHLSRLVSADEIVALLKKAHAEFPHRAEAPYHLMRHYSQHRRWKKAYDLVATFTLTDQGLFVDQEIINWKFDLERSVVCHYAGKYEDACQFAFDLLDKPTTPAQIQQQILKNLKFSLAPVMHKSRQSKLSVKFLNLGHPRTGTGFIARSFQSLGFDVRHEQLGCDGISDWAMTFDQQHSWTTRWLCYEMLEEIKYITYCVRDPWTSLASIQWSEKGSENIRARWIPEMRDAKGLERAARSLIGFDKQIRRHRKVDAVLRIEHAAEDLKESFLAKYVPDDWVPPPANTNARSHPETTMDEWLALLPNTVQKLDQYCERYGYDSISKRIKQ